MDKEIISAFISEECHLETKQGRHYKATILSVKENHEGIDEVTFRDKFHALVQLPCHDIAKIERWRYELRD